MSCSASNHIGITTIDEPPISETAISVWAAYYYDQLDAFEGAVAPPDPKYPDAAKKGYTEALGAWNEQVKYARGRTTLLTISIALLTVSGTILYIEYASKREVEPVTW